mmetsp:Transcript_3574/g.10098  ORF Transcript_3574/g.10098 Transcript_3574/m.10098 type:complete len:102 (-) Transcript_3574:1082-1387(-)
MRDQLFDQEDEEDDEEDWDDFYDYWDEEEDIVSSPLDNVDAHVYFSDSLNLMQQNDAEKFQACTSALDLNVQQGLQAVIQYAAERRQALAAAAAAAQNPGK